MNKKQWYVLAGSCLLLGMLFIGLDTINGSCLKVVMNSDMSLNSYDVWCIVNAEIYEPFIYLSYSLWIIFMICGSLEPKKKN